MFREDVTQDNFYNNALADLDTLYDVNLQKLFTKCSELVVKRFWFESNVLYMDSIDIFFCGIEYEPDKEDTAVLKQNGHPKDHNYGLLYELQIATDLNRILHYIKPYPGNIAGCVFQKKIFTEDERKNLIVVADCKMATAGNIIRLSEISMKFLFKCVANFIVNCADKIADAFVSHSIHPFRNNGCMSELEYKVKLGKSHTKHSDSWHSEKKKGKIEGAKANGSVSAESQ